MDILDIAVRLGVATLIGVLLGLNRDLHGKSTGVRTLGLVCLGSALAVLSIHAATGTEESRVIQGIVTGVGFLGAGVIIRSEKGHRARAHHGGLRVGDRVRGRGLRDCAVADRRDRRCARADPSRVWRAVRESDRSTLAGATERAFGSATRQNAAPGPEM
jgi:hypothetical protein